MRHRVEGRGGRERERSGGLKGVKGGRRGGRSGRSSGLIHVQEKLG